MKYKTYFDLLERCFNYFTTQHFKSLDDKDCIAIWCNVADFHGNYSAWVFGYDIVNHGLRVTFHNECLVVMSTSDYCFTINIALTPEHYSTVFQLMKGCFKGCESRLQDYERFI